MKKQTLFAGLVALALSGLLTVPAQAQATRTWISGVGSNSNPCSRTAPCKTFPGAISMTAAGGGIDTLDPGGFGAVTVLKSITLANEGIGEAGILVAGTNGVFVNCTPSGSEPCVIILRGLHIDGGPTISNSLAGVKFIAGRVLEIQNCSIRNFTGGSPNGYGVSFTPSNGAGELDISDTTITTNGQLGGGATIGAGVYIAPTGTSAVKATLERVQLYNNTNGIRIDMSTATGGTLNMLVDHTVVDNSGFHGIALVNGASATKSVVNIKHSSVENNAGTGIISNGANAVVNLNDVDASGNNFGVQVANTGVMNSYKNNMITGNNTDNTAALTLITPN